MIALRSGRLSSQPLMTTLCHGLMQEGTSLSKRANALSLVKVRSNYSRRIRFSTHACCKEPKGITAFVTATPHTFFAALT